MALDTNSASIISPCGTYRHQLTRRWSAGPTCGFIMLNPSTADAEHDERQPAGRSGVFGHQSNRTTKLTTAGTANTARNLKTRSADREPRR